MAFLPEQPTLKDLQYYMNEVSKERGWVKDNYAQKFLLFTEEIGELAKAIRKTEGLYEEKAKKKNIELEEEFADVLSYLLDLANWFQIDLENAFRKKEQINQTRTWWSEPLLPHQPQSQHRRPWAYAISNSIGGR